MGKQYTISEIETNTGISRRTIHYYIKKKLIPPASGAGGGAYYSDEHIIKLKLIKEMQNSHLKLSGIKQALDAMTLTEMENLYNRAKTGNVNWTSDSLENWMVEDGRDNGNNLQTSQSSDNDQSLTDNPKNEDDFNYLEHLKRTTLPDSSWKRFYVIDGVEINIRKDIMEKYKSAVMWWIKYLRSQV